ncbi:MAG: hypothetical protein RLZ12_754 [Bacillota bacterium]|jgi:inhibitor of the pro-sigma K processing machinery
MDNLAMWGLGSVGSVVLLMLLSGSWKKPFIWFGYGCIYIGCGGLTLFVVNLIGMHFNYHLPINPFTALVTGFLGGPGLVSVMVMHQII